MVNIDIRPEVYERFPEFSCHALSVVLPDQLQISVSKLGEIDKMVNEKVLSWPETISELDSVKAWRKAFRAMGLKPRKTLSSVEALMKRAKTGRWKTGSPIVEVYNAFSIMNSAPMGGYDCGSFINSNITVRNAIQSEDTVVSSSKCNTRLVNA